MPSIRSVSHATTLPYPMASPSLAYDPVSGTAFLVGPGIVRIVRGGAAETIVAPGNDVPVDAGVSLVSGMLRTFGGHNEGDERGANGHVITYLAGAVVSTEVNAMPARRGVLARQHRDHTILFGGVDETSRVKREVFGHKEGKPAKKVATMPAAAAYLQGGWTERGFYLLGSGTYGADLLAHRDGLGDPTVSTVEPLSPEGEMHGVAVANDKSDTFYFLGGRDDRRTSATLWHFSEDHGTQRIGTIALGDEPWAIHHAAAWFDQGALFVAGGTRTVGATEVPEARVLRIEVDPS